MKERKNMLLNLLLAKIQIFVVVRLVLAGDLNAKMNN